MPLPAKLPLVIVFWGFTATGKSSLARAWSATHHFAYFNTDILRKQLANLPLNGRGGFALGQGIYSAEFSRQTYDLLLAKTLTALAEDGVGGVVLDGSFLALAERARLVAALAGKADLRFVFCQCPENIIRQRLALRAADPNAVSEGTWAVYLRQKEHYDPPDELAKRQLLVLDTTAPLADLCARLDEAFLKDESRT